jgi:hypothetical protein
MRLRDSTELQPKPAVLQGLCKVLIEVLVSYRPSTSKAAWCLLHSEPVVKFTNCNLNATQAVLSMLSNADCVMQAPCTSLHL